MQNRMGKILQERQSININRNTQSTTISTQMDYLVPEGKIATLPQGYMVGQVADNYGEPITQKNFNGLIRVDTAKIAREERNYQPIPDFYRFDDAGAILERNRNRIYNDIQKILMDQRKEDKSSPLAHDVKAAQS